MSEHNYSDDADTNDGRVTVWALQDLKESLDAIAEQLRIANLITLGEQLEPSVCFVCDVNPCDRDGHEEHYGPDELRPEIREALGLRE